MTEVLAYAHAKRDFPKRLLISEKAFLRQSNYRLLRIDAAASFSIAAGFFGCIFSKGRAPSTEWPRFRRLVYPAVLAIVADAVWRNVAFALSVSEGPNKLLVEELYRDVSKDGKVLRVVTEDQLREYAARHRLPEHYVPKFIREIVGKDAKHVDFNRFKKYVEAREKALKTTFKSLDSNDDGQISYSELFNGLSQIRLAFKKCGQPLEITPELTQNMIEVMGGGKRDNVSFEDFRRFFILLPAKYSPIRYWAFTAEMRYPTIDCGNNMNLGITSRGRCKNIHTDSCTADQLISESKTEEDQIQVHKGVHLFAGALGGAISRTVTAPLETIRLRLLVGSNGASKNVFYTTFQKIVSEDGPRGLFKGNLTNVVRSAPAKGIDFFAFELYKSGLANLPPWLCIPDSAQKILAGSLAGGTSTTLLYPLDVVRTRVTSGAIQPVSGGLVGIFQVMSEIKRTEGLRALYFGLKPSLIGILPEAGIVYGSFDLLKQYVAAKLGVQDLGVAMSLSCGITAAVTGQAVAYPLEAISRNMALMGAKAQPPSMFQVARELFRQHGVGGFYRGLPAATVRVIPMALLSFGTYEAIRRAIIRISSTPKDILEEEECCVEEEQQCHATEACYNIFDDSSEHDYGHRLGHRLAARSCG